MRNSRTIFFFFCLTILFIPDEKLFAFSGDTLLFVRDSVLFKNNFSSENIFKSDKPREVRNYIRPCIYINAFNTGSRPMKGSVPALNHRLGDYQFATGNIGAYIPLYTHTKLGKKDSTNINTFHLLLTINALADHPTFSGLEKQHILYKTGIGLRAIYGFGSRAVLFIDASPYLVGDKYDKQQTQQLRLASSFVFNYMVSPDFSWRLGATKTFLFGNRLYLPMVGFRVGKLDSKFYFSVQFPRYISFNFQPSPKFSWSIYSKAYGGLYNISNGDSLYMYGDSVIQFGQTGLINGVRFDFRFGPNFSFFASGGFAVRNHIWLYSYSYNQMYHQRPLAHFYNGVPDPSLFLNFGLTWRFGQAKKSSGNYLMYDIFSLNNDMDPGDNNSGPGNGDITPEMKKKKDMKKVQYKDVIDLIDDTDLY
jgi:hypothetical protein